MQKPVLDIPAENCEKQMKAPLGEKKSKLLRLKVESPFYLLILPAAIVVLLFNYLPMAGLLLAFKDWNAKLGVFDSPWTDMFGFGNFVRLFQTADMTRAIWNTFYFNVVSMLFNFTAPIILALLFTEVKNKYFKKVTQTISYLPHFLSIAAVTGIVNTLLSEYGLINSMMYKWFGIEEGQDILSNPDAFLPVYVLTEMWQSIGWGSIIYLSALSGVDAQLYEAARIDGAGKWKQLIHVTLPGIVPTIITMLLLKIGQLMTIGYEKTILLYNEATYETSDIISSYVYRMGLIEQNWSYSTAIGLFNSAINLVLLVIANRLSKRYSETSLW